MFKIQTLNNISVAGLDRLPRDSYEIASEIAHPDAILVRSAKMHDMAIPETLKAIGRAGAGVNNIPVPAMTARGIAVFNAPGANANAVKELVIAGMLIAARNIGQAWSFARGLSGDDAAINKAVESGKKHFVGFELPGPYPGRHRSRGHRGQGRQCRPGAWDEGRRLRPDHHGAARLAAGERCAAGHLHRRPAVALRFRDLPCAPDGRDPAHDQRRAHQDPQKGCGAAQFLARRHPGRRCGGHRA